MASVLLWYLRYNALCVISPWKPYRKWDWARNSILMKMIDVWILFSNHWNRSLFFYMWNGRPVSGLSFVNDGILVCATQHMTGLILDLHPANERRRYKVTPSLIGWAQTQNQSYRHASMMCHASRWVNHSVTAPIHYLEQCWLIISRFMCHSPIATEAVSAFSLTNNPGRSDEKKQLVVVT